MEMFTFRGLDVNHLEKEVPVAFSLIGIKENEVLCIVRCCLPQAVGIKVPCELSSRGFEQDSWVPSSVFHLVSAVNEYLKSINSKILLLITFWVTNVYTSSIYKYILPVEFDKIPIWYIYFVEIEQKGKESILSVLMKDCTTGRLVSKLKWFNMHSVEFDKILIWYIYFVENEQKGKQSILSVLTKDCTNGRLVSKLK
jgi:hypothetical protein